MILYFQYQPDKNMARMCDKGDNYERRPPQAKEYEGIFVILEGNPEVFQGKSCPVFAAIEKNGHRIRPTQCEYAVRRAAHLNVASRYHHGGGFLKVEKDVLTLSGSAVDYGKFDPEVVSDLKNELISFFKVKQIVIVR